MLEAEDGLESALNSDVSATESEIRRDIARARNRYVDDEAKESDN